MSFTELVKIIINIFFGTQEAIGMIITIESISSRNKRKYSEQGDKCTHRNDIY